jgi:hypothetical protein
VVSQSSHVDHSLRVRAIKAISDAQDAGKANDEGSLLRRKFHERIVPLFGVGPSVIPREQRKQRPIDIARAWPVAPSHDTGAVLVMLLVSHHHAHIVHERSSVQEQALLVHGVPCKFAPFTKLRKRSKEAQREVCNMSRVRGGGMWSVRRTEIEEFACVREQ